MSIQKILIRLALAAALLGSLGACTIVPAHPGAYRGSTVYVETYPTYRYGYSGPYYGYRDHRHDGYRDGRHERDARRYDGPRRMDSPLESAARTHRDVRRSLGLPRLPGMP
jgi:hypothetical protein